MKSNGRWILLAAVLLFIGYVVYGTASRTSAQCEVCLEFDGQMVCRSGAGETQEAALRAAQESACGGNAQGMTEVIACRNRVPESAQCTSG